MSRVGPVTCYPLHINNLYIQVYKQYMILHVYLSAEILDIQSSRQPGNQARFIGFGVLSLPVSYSYLKVK